MRFPPFSADRNTVGHLLAVLRKIDEAKQALALAEATFDRFAPQYMGQHDPIAAAQVQLQQGQQELDTIAGIEQMRELCARRGKELTAQSVLDLRAWMMKRGGPGTDSGLVDRLAIYAFVQTFSMYEEQDEMQKLAPKGIGPPIELPENTKPAIPKVTKTPALSLAEVATLETEDDTEPDSQRLGKWIVRPGEARFDNGPFFDVNGVTRQLLIRLVEAKGRTVLYDRLKEACGNDQMNDETLRNHVLRLNRILKKALGFATNPVTCKDGACRLRLPEPSHSLPKSRKNSKRISNAKRDRH